MEKFIEEVDCLNDLNTLKLLYDYYYGNLAEFDGLLIHHSGNKLLEYKNIPTNWDIARDKCKAFRGIRYHMAIGEYLLYTIHNKLFYIII